MGLESYLNQPNCTVFEPQYEYERNGETHTLIKKEISPEDLLQREKFVSEQMIANTAKSLQEALEDSIPVLYLDVSQKGNYNLVLYICKAILDLTKNNPQNIKESRSNDEKVVLFGELLKEYSLIGEKLLAIDEKSSYDSIVNNYIDELSQYKQDYPQRAGQINDLELKFQTPMIAGTMELCKQKKVYLYLDHLSNLTEAEQRSINDILSWRGRTDGGTLHVKINNANNNWNIRKNHSGHFVQAIHDYSSIAVDKQT